VQEKHPSFVLTPQCPQGKQWVNTSWGKGSYSVGKIAISEEMTLALEILDEVMKKYSIDPARVYVSGQSMGGYGSWDALLRRPKLFAAAIINCGAGDPSHAESIKDIPIWNFHGDKDSTVPTRGSREMVEALQRVNAKIKYSELPGVGHDCWTKGWKTPELGDWLFKQARQ